MTDKDAKELIHLNQRLSYVLGVATGLLLEYENVMVSNDKRQFDWINKAIENLLYLDKPLPKIPQK